MIASCWAQNEGENVESTAWLCSGRGKLVKKGSGINEVRINNKVRGVINVEGPKRDKNMLEDVNDRVEKMVVAQGFKDKLVKIFGVR